MYSSGTEIKIDYDLGVTILSLIAAIICLYIGLRISSHDMYFESNVEDVCFRCVFFLQLYNLLTYFVQLKNKLVEAMREYSIRGARSHRAAVVSAIL